MKLKLNGTEAEHNEGTTVAELLRSMNVRTEGVAVELNREIIRKQDYAGRVLEDGDALEIVNLVGGG